MKVFKIVRTEGVSLMVKGDEISFPERDAPHPLIIITKQEGGSTKVAAIVEPSNVVCVCENS